MISPIRRGVAAAAVYDGAAHRHRLPTGGGFLLVVNAGLLRPDGRGPAPGEKQRRQEPFLHHRVDPDEFSTGGVYEPAEVDDTVLRERYGLSDEEVADYYGYYSSVDGYADTLLAVRGQTRYGGPGGGDPH